MGTDGEPGNELQQGEQVVNDVGLSDEQVEPEVEFTAEWLVCFFFFLGRGGRG